METKDIVILAFVLVFVSFRLYQKYGKKNGKNTDSGKNADSIPSGSSREDDYEPYSKNR